MNNLQSQKTREGPSFQPADPERFPRYITTKRPLSRRVAQEVIGYARILDAQSLGPQAFRLLYHFALGEGETGCRHTERELAQLCHMSNGAVHRAYKELVAAQLISHQSTGVGRGRVNHVQVEDLIAPNGSNYSELLQSEDNCSTGEQFSRDGTRDFLTKKSIPYVENTNVSRERGPAATQGPTAGLADLEECFKPVELGHEVASAVVEPYDTQSLEELFTPTSEPVIAQQPAQAAQGSRYRLRRPERTKESITRTKRTPTLKLGDRPIPEFVWPKIYELCYGMQTAEQRRALTRWQAWRVAEVAAGLNRANADFTKLDAFGRWWASDPWRVKRRPTPAMIGDLWWAAMEDINGESKDRAETPAEKTRRVNEEYARWEAGRNTGAQR